MSLLPLVLLLAADPPPPADPHDPPPPGAVARIGNTRLRTAGPIFLSADGKTAVEASAGAVNVWDSATGRRVDRIPVAGTHLSAAGYEPKAGRLVVLGTTDAPEGTYAHTTNVWVVDVPGRQLLQAVRLPAEPRRYPWRTAASADGRWLAVAYNEGGVRTWNLDTGEEAGGVATPPLSPDHVAISPDGKTVAYARAVTAVSVGEVGSPGESRPLVLPAGFRPGAVAFGPDGKALFVASPQHGRVLVVDVASGKTTGELTAPAGGHALAASPDGKTLAVAYYPGWKDAPDIHAVILWDVATGRERRRLPTGRGYADRLAWSADGSRLAASAGGRLAVWDAGTGKPVTPPPVGHEGPIEYLAFGPDGRLFTAGTDNVVYGWDPHTGLPGPPLERGGTGYPTALAVSADGRLAAGAGGPVVRVWDARTGAARHTLKSNSRLNGSRALGFSPDGGRLVAWGYDLRLRTFDLATGKVLADHPTYPDGVDAWDEAVDRDYKHGIRAAAVSADAARFAVAVDGQVRVYDTATGKERRRLAPDPNGVARVAFSPDGIRLAVSGAAKFVQMPRPDGSVGGGAADEHPLAVWDLATGKEVWRVATPGTGIRDPLGWTPDGSRVVELVDSAGQGLAFRLRDAATGADAGRVPAADAAGGFAVAPDGKRVAVPLRDGTAAIYDLSTAKK